MCIQFARLIDNIYCQVFSQTSISVYYITTSKIKLVHAFDSDINDDNKTKHNGPTPTCLSNRKRHMFQQQQK